MNPIGSVTASAKLLEMNMKVVGRVGGRLLDGRGEVENVLFKLSRTPRIRRDAQAGRGLLRARERIERRGFAWSRLLCDAVGRIRLNRRVLEVSQFLLELLGIGGTGRVGPTSGHRFWH